MNEKSTDYNTLDNSEKKGLLCPMEYIEIPPAGPPREKKSSKFLILDTSSNSLISKASCNSFRNDNYKDVKILIVDDQNYNHDAMMIILGTNIDLDT